MPVLLFTDDKVIDSRGRADLIRAAARFQRPSIHD
jgi:hypothetical protein